MFLSRVGQVLVVGCVMCLCASVGRSYAPCETAKLTADNAAEGDHFGWAVSLSGDYALVGAYRHDEHAGTAYLLERQTMAWPQTELVHAEVATDDQYGYSAAISGFVAVVGAPQDDPGSVMDAGAAFVYRGSAGGAWLLEDELVAGDGEPADKFGYAVAADGDVIAVGAPFDNDAAPVRGGSVYVFRFDGVDAWVEEDHVTASDVAVGDQFGGSVAVDGNTLVVGSPYDDLDAGAAHVFHHDGVGNWEQTQKLAAVDDAGLPDDTPGDRFGNSVAVSGNRIVVGARYSGESGSKFGAAYVFKWGGSNWVIDKKLTASDAVAEDQFGRSVSISGDLVLVGAYKNDEGANDVGAAYLFQRVVTTWVEVGKFLASDAEEDDRLGLSAAIDGDYAVVGAYSNDDAGDASGSAYVLRVTADDDCNENGSPDECDIAAGTSLDLNENGVPDECECVTHADCDDSLDCTIDVCNPATHHCEYTIDSGYCLIDDTCFDDGTVNLEADCYFCDAGLDQEAWSVRSTGSPCGDPTASDCDLADTCDGLGSCLDNLVDDGASCTDEGNDCTDDICAAGVCVHPFLEPGAPCGDPSDTECTDPDTCDGLGVCLSNHAEDETECPNGLFCDGADSCVDGMCESFDPPCGGPGMACDEVVDLCYCYDLPACNGRYVDVNATGPTHDGSSWCQAYTSLQVAIETAEASGGSIPELWVAEGTYKPTKELIPGDSRSVTFSLLNGLAIRGGFAGCDAPNPDERDVDLYETILTGELDDGGLRAYNVVTCSFTIETAVLDGFTVIHGSADTSPSFTSGGGMFGSWASPTLIDCYFHTNFASGYGGGVSLSNGHARLYNCRFASNTAAFGGGLVNWDADTELTDCSFHWNSADSAVSGEVNLGGGICNLWDAQPILRRCTFGTNSADAGGAMYNDEGCNPTVYDSTFTSNSAEEYGGAFANCSSGMTLHNCVLRGNWTDGNGGAVYISSVPTRTGGTTDRQLPADDMDRPRADGIPKLFNCTLYANLAEAPSGHGGGIYVEEASVTLNSCILWANRDSNGTTESAQITLSFGAVSPDYNCIQYWSGALGGTENTGQDPLFVDADGVDDIPGTSDDNLRLTLDSPSINAGDPDLPSAGYGTDLDGRPRVLCDRVDRGAYESGLGNYDCDADVDLTDFASWDTCMTGPDAGPYDDECEAFDSEHDWDVDLRDFAAFQSELTNP